MSTPLVENVKNGLNKKKRKYDLVRDECDPELQILTSNLKKKKKLKRKSSNGFFPYNESSHKYLQYENTGDYVSVEAYPESLQLTPLIFKKNQFRNSFNNVSDSPILNLISMSNFNTDVSQRFNHVALIRQNICNFVNKETNEELNLSQNTRENRKSLEKERRNKKHKNVDLASESNSVNEEENILEQVKVYRVKEDKGSIFHMHHRSSFSFHGEIKITVLSGEIEILGYTVSHSSSKNSVDVYSPNFYTGMVVETKPSNKNKEKMEIETVLKDFLSENDIKCILNDFGSDDALVFIEQINSIVGTVLNKYWEKPLFSKDLEDVSSECLKVVQSLFNFKLSSKGKHFKKNLQWDNIPLGSCTVLCGGKGVGKSTLLKYYMNKLVSQGEKVLCLDFDVGQPEFTCSGFVSAVIVDQPLLGPNFTHLIDPGLMMYFGDIDVAQNPSRYLECVKHVIESCKKNEEYSRMRWFVNTMGFCKGLGVYLTTTIIKLLQPNTVIQIQDTSKNNYPFYLTATNLNSRKGFKSMPLENVQVFHDLRVVKSYSKKNEALKPRQLRDILSLAYFSKMVSPPYYNFNAVQPYLISFSQLYLGINSLIDFNDILKAFNANIVSLFNFEPDSEEVYSVDSDEDNYFKIVVKPKPTPCLGLGLVRGIDCSEKKFYILTHLCSEKLKNVNCLCLERISPPHSMFLKQETVEGQRVYTTIGNFSVIQRVKRMFHG